MRRSTLPQPQSDKVPNNYCHRERSHEIMLSYSKQDGGCQEANKPDLRTEAEEADNACADISMSEAKYSDPHDY